jgi:hypothetical protein
MAKLPSEVMFPPLTTEVAVTEEVSAVVTTGNTNRAGGYSFLIQPGYRNSTITAKAIVPFRIVLFFILLIGVSFLSDVFIAE